MTPPEASTGLAYVVTWALANATALGSVYKWFTRPLEEKIASVARLLEDKLATLRTDLDKLDKRVEKVDGYVNPRASMVEHLPTVGELVRRLEELEEWRRDMDEFRASVVTDEEFRAYTVLVASKIESVLGKLGWITGRLGGKVE